MTSRLIHRSRCVNSQWRLLGEAAHNPDAFVARDSGLLLGHLDFTGPTSAGQLCPLLMLPPCLVWRGDPTVDVSLSQQRRVRRAQQGLPHGLCLSYQRPGPWGAGG